MTPTTWPLDRVATLDYGRPLLVHLPNGRAVILGAGINGFTVTDMRGVRLLRLELAVLPERSPSLPVPADAFRHGDEPTCDDCGDLLDYQGHEADHHDWHPDCGFYWCQRCDHGVWVPG